MAPFSMMFWVSVLGAGSSTFAYFAFEVLSKGHAGLGRLVLNR